MLPIKRYMVYNNEIGYKPVYGTSYNIDQANDRILSIKMGSNVVAVYLEYTHFQVYNTERSLSV